MWFEFPQNVSSISVERQQFKAEHTIDAEDEKGKPIKRRFFRAPEHFAPQILNQGLKITAVAPGEDWPEDLPKEEVISAAAETAATLSNLQTENSRLRDMLNEVTKERDELKGLSIALAAEIKTLKTPSEPEEGKRNE